MNYKILNKDKQECLLLIHGFGISFEIWNKIAIELKKHYKLVIVELPGIGKSKLNNIEINYYEHCSEELEILRNKERIKKWTIIGYSTGTRVAEKYVEKYSKSVSKCVLIFPIFLNVKRTLFLRILAKLDDISPKVVDFFVTKWRLYILIIVLGFNGIPRKEAKNWYNLIKQNDINILKKTIKDIPEYGTSKFKINKVPTLLIWGKTDFIPKRPNYHPIDVFIKAGHDAITTKPKIVIQSIKPFLKS